MLKNHDRNAATYAGIRNPRFLGRLQNHSRRTSLSKVTIVALAWAFCGLMLALTYSTEEWQATAGILIISQAFTGSVALKRFKVIRSAIFPDLLTLILIYQFGNKVLTLIGLFFGSLDNSSSVVSNVLSTLGGVSLKYQFQAELVFLLATLVFTFVWRRQEAKNVLALWHEPRSKVLWITYSVSLIGYLVITSSGFAGAFGLIPELLRLFSIGAIAVLLGGGSAYALGKTKSWVTILALAPLFILALKSSMKAEIALVFFPLLLPIARRMTAGRLTFVFSFLIFVVLFVFPFSQAWREANWVQGGGSQKVGISEVAANVANLWEKDGILETAQISTARWLSRGSTSQSGGLVMQIAERDGFIGPVLIQGLTSILVPRFLWPDKPTYAPGAWFTWYLGQADTPETATTSTAMMLGTELYWMFGVAGVILGMSLIAVLNFKVWRFLVKGSVKGLVPMVALFAMMGRTGGLEEVHTIYAISSPVILLVYVVLFDKMQRVLVPWLTKPQRTRKYS